MPETEMDLVNDFLTPALAHAPLFIGAATY